MFVFQRTFFTIQLLQLVLLPIQPHHCPCLPPILHVVDYTKVNHNAR
jgi:hypothetical protein